MQIQEVGSTSQKIGRDQLSKLAVASHHVKKVALKDHAKERSIQIQKSLKKADPSKDEAIRQRILAGTGRSQKLAALEEINAQALDAGTRSYEGPLIMLKKTSKNYMLSPTPTDQNVTVKAPIPLKMAMASASTAPVTTPVLSITTSFNGLFGSLKGKISHEEEKTANNTTLTKEDIFKVLTEHQDDIGLSDKDQEMLKLQSLKTLQPLIDEFYIEETHKWDFSFADQTSIMSCIKLALQEEGKFQPKTVGKLHINKCGSHDFLGSIQAARGTIENEETVKLTSPVPAPPRLTYSSEAPKAPKPSTAPKVMSQKSQEVLTRLAQKKEDARKGGSLLEQIRHKDLLIKLTSPSITSSQSKAETPPIQKDKSLEDIRKLALAMRRRSMEIQDNTDDD